MEELLRELLAEQRRTNQLLELQIKARIIDSTLNLAIPMKELRVWREEIKAEVVAVMERKTEV